MDTDSIGPVVLMIALLALSITAARANRRHKAC